MLQRRSAWILIWHSLLLLVFLFLALGTFLCRLLLKLGLYRLPFLAEGSLLSLLCITHMCYGVTMSVSYIL